MNNIKICQTTKWYQRPTDQTLEEYYLKKTKSKVLARILANRRIQPESYSVYSRSSTADLSDPFSLKGIREAKDILLEASRSGMKAAIIGDYDCDGVCSSALMSFVLTDLNIQHEIFLPERMEHGYGLNSKTIKAFCERFAGKIPELLVVVDCGTSSDDKIKELREFGIKKIVIIDHHIVDEKNLSKSADALVNWRLCDFNEQCASGEVFTLIRSFDGRFSEARLMPYAAVGTVADVMPIWGDNRIIVRNGLNTYHSARTPGLTILSQQFGTSRSTVGVSQDEIAFKVAPKINAVGRLETPYTAHQAVMEADRSIAHVMAQDLEVHNKERKLIQGEIVEQAYKKISETPPEYGILVFDPSWHIGVVGIVASRLVEKYGVPCMVFGQHNGAIRGSGRSIDGFNLKSAMDSCSELFEAYGGHEMAAGATMKPDMLSVAQEVFNTACKRHWVSNKVKDPKKYYDMEIETDDINQETIDLIRSVVYPYCRKHNPEPVFLLKGASITDADSREGTGWAKMSFYCNGVLNEFVFFMNEVSGIYRPEELNGQQADVYFTFSQKKELDREPELMVSDLRLLSEK